MVAERIVEGLKLRVEYDAACREYQSADYSPNAWMKMQNITERFGDWLAANDDLSEIMADLTSRLVIFINTGKVA